MSASTIASPPSTYSQRLQHLRNAMRNAEIDALILPSADPHQSEYVAQRWAARTHFSGFTGSAGTAVLTLDGGGVWTDSRYYVQAPRELERTSGLPMMKAKQGGSEYVTWLSENLPEGATVGIDGQLFTVKQVRAIQQAFAKAAGGKKGLELRTDVDILHEAWPDRPALPTSTLFSHDVKYAGRSVVDKLDDLRHHLTEAGLTHTVLTALDEIAWLLNIRASDIHCNPLAIAYAIVGLQEVTLFTAPDRIDEATQRRFARLDIKVRPYADIDRGIRELPQDARIGIDEAQVNYKLARQLSSEFGGPVAPEQVVAFPSPLRLAKAIKNETEIAHIRVAHEKDGVALVRAFRWLEHELRERTVRECEFVDLLTQERAKQALYYGPSFDAIVGYGANAALPHYRSIPGEDAEINPHEGILLVDSGGQYQDGTTDITRTFGLGKVTDEQRTRYTLVLKGHIALAQAVFPVGTKGIQLDVLARQHLWQQGLNFGHGTGHGVGFFLNVHEPPQGVAPGLSERGRTGFQAGMFTSNEPGYYLEGKYGIRIENLVLAIPAFDEDEEEEENEFLRFETITYFPIDYLLLEPDLLTADERRWLNAYHAEVYERLSPRLDEDEREWLRDRCESL